jgi:hypothetical protein
MTVSTMTSKDTFTGNGSTTQFNLTFPVKSADDLQVWLYQGGAWSLKTYGADYTLIFTSTYPIVNFATAPANGTTILALRWTKPLQSLDLVEGDILPSSAIEATLDRMSTGLIDQRRELDKISRDPGDAWVSFSAGTPKLTWGTSAPTLGTWSRGDICWNTEPSAGGYVGWVCVTGGSPGTWKGFGAIAS